MVARIASRRRNVMRAFKIDELSCVDRPAQEGARMTIMKRFDPEPQEPTMHKVIHDNPPRAFHSLEDAMKFLADQNPTMPSSDIMSAAARQYPDLHKQYNEQGERSVQKAVDEQLTIMRRPPSVIAFENLVDEIRRRDGCDNVTALRRARAEHPREFAEYSQS